MMAHSEIDLADGDTVVTLVELAQAIGMDRHWVEELVAEGVVHPVAPDGGFSTISILRLRRAQRLHHAFTLNTSGLALALDLLEEIDRLRAELARHGR